VPGDVVEDPDPDGGIVGNVGFAVGLRSMGREAGTVASSGGGENGSRSDRILAGGVDGAWVGALVGEGPRPPRRLGASLGSSTNETIATQPARPAAATTTRLSRGVSGMHETSWPWGAVAYAS
jgi:hypothetical protein